MFGKHRLGIYEKAFAPFDNWGTALDKAARLGFDFVEISVDESDMRLARLNWNTRQIGALRRQAEESGVAISSMCLSGHRRFPFGSQNPAVRQAAHTILDRAINLALELGVRVIQLAGYDVYYEPSSSESVAYFQEGMRWAGARAAANQLMLAMEIMDTPFMNSITKYMAYEKLVSSPWFRVYPDMGNLCAWEENDPDAEFALGIHSMVGVHVKDTLPPTRESPGQFRGVPFGSGCVNFARQFGQLERLGYTGPYMIEMWHQPGINDVDAIAAAQGWLKEQFLSGIDLQNSNS